MVMRGYAYIYIDTATTPTIIFQSGDSKYERAKAEAAEMVKAQPKKAAAAALNRGAWAPEEDKKLVDYVRLHGDHNWRTLPEKAGLKRCGKSCRLRWLNYLRPNIKRVNITKDEEDLIIQLHNLFGNKWSLITARLPGRTDNEIKNYWNSHSSKRALSTNDLNRKLFINPNFSSQPLQVNDTTTVAAPGRPLPVRRAPRQKCLDRCAAPVAVTMVHENGVTIRASTMLAVGWSGEISPMMKLSMPKLIDTYEEFDGMVQLLDWANHTERQTGASDDVVVGSQEKDAGGSSSLDGLGA